MVDPDVDLAGKLQAPTMRPPGPRAGPVTLMSELQPSVESVNCHQNEGRSRKRMYSSSANVLASVRNVAVTQLSVTEGTKFEETVPISKQTKRGNGN
jgi:hypothetical protein